MAAWSPRQHAREKKQKGLLPPGFPLRPEVNNDEY